MNTHSQDRTASQEIARECMLAWIKHKGEGGTLAIDSVIEPVIRKALRFSGINNLRQNGTFGNFIDGMGDIYERR